MAFEEYDGSVGTPNNKKVCVEPKHNILLSCSQTIDNIPIEFQALFHANIIIMISVHDLYRKHGGLHLLKRILTNKTNIQHTGTW